jgi:sulfide:quinone oxidoreductase
MNTKHLTHDLSVASQLAPDDVSVAAAMGFKSILCNRPDGEDLSQNLFEEIRTAAKRLDIQTAYLPIKVSGPTQDNKAEVVKLMATLPKPVLAYCKTGERSEALLSKFFEAET